MLTCLATTPTERNLWAAALMAAIKREAPRSIESDWAASYPGLQLVGYATGKAAGREHTPAATTTTSGCCCSRGPVSVGRVGSDGRRECSSPHAHRSGGGPRAGDVGFDGTAEIADLRHMRHRPDDDRKGEFDDRLQDANDYADILKEQSTQLLGHWASLNAKNGTVVGTAVRRDVLKFRAAMAAYGNLDILFHLRFALVRRSVSPRSVPPRSAPRTR